MTEQQITQEKLIPVITDVTELHLQNIGKYVSDILQRK
jgi:hypothetical protein